MVEMFLFSLLFYNALDLNNQKILCLPSICQFERIVTDLNHPNLQVLFRHCIVNIIAKLTIFVIKATKFKTEPIFEQVKTSL